MDCCRNGGAARFELNVGQWGFRGGEPLAAGGRLARGGWCGDDWGAEDEKGAPGERDAFQRVGDGGEEGAKMLRN